jgi:hypothetical protein
MLDKDTAVKTLCTHIEGQWQQYAEVVPNAFLGLIGNDWQRVPVQVESDEPESYVRACRTITRYLNPSAVAFAARGVGGDQRFYAAVEFPDDPVRRSLIWRIVGDALVDYRVENHEPSDDDDDEMRMFKPTPVAPAAPPVDPSELGNLKDTQWKSLRTPVIRIIMEHQQRRGEG